jgi:hypothetical protein
MEIAATKQYRQFMWGLSRGISVFALSGTFWFCMAAFSREFNIWSAIPIAFGCIGIMYGFFGVRKKAAGFKYSDLKSGDVQELQQNRRLIIGFRCVGVGETLLVWSAVGLSFWMGRPDLMWSAIGVAVSLHFAPLGYLFHIPIYYLTSAAGCVVSIISMFQAKPLERSLFLGLGMGFIMWSTAIFATLKADRLANRTH